MLSAVIAGTMAGVFCGLVPGLHTNLIAGAVVFARDGAWWWVVFLVSFAVARSIADAVPSVFLGASDDVLSLHPAQALFKKGKGRLAVKCSVAGALLGVIACIATAPFLFVGFPVAYAVARPFLFWLVLAAVVFLWVQEDEWYFAVLVFFLTGFFGLLALGAAKEPLFPMLSGLFGASGLVLSLRSGSFCCLQEERDVLIPKRKVMAGSLLGVLAGCVLILAPGLGPSQGAAVVRPRRLGVKGYLVLTGALGTVDVVVSLIMVAVLGRARNGAVVAVQSLVGTVSSDMLIALLAASLCAAGIASASALYLSRMYVLLVEQVELHLVRIGVLVLLAAGSFLLSGAIGLLIFGVGIALGLLAPLLGVSRSHAMGCLLLPTLLGLW